MILTVKTVNSLRGSIKLPTSKSYSLRAFLIASCGGQSLIINPSDCDDALVARKIARQLGSRIHSFDQKRWKVQAFKNPIRSLRINVGESGTVLRFLLPLLALKKGQFVVDGQGTLKSRPNFHLNQTLRRMGVDIKGRGPKESVPIKIKGGTMKGGLVSIDGTLSSQFISALMIACPQLKGDTHLRLTGRKIVSKNYLLMTQNVLEKAGIKIKKLNARSFYIKGNQEFRGMKSFEIPADYGLAAFLLTGAALTHSEVTLRGNFCNDLIQSDSAIISFLKRMGVQFTKTDRSIKIHGPFCLKGGNFSLKDAPDLVPIMTVAALFAQGKTRLYDIRHVRAKESDRISDLRQELLKIGARIDEKANEITIDPCADYRTNMLLDPHRDHRLAMAFCILGLKIGTRIKDVECVSKSYPGFVKDFKKLGASVHY